MLGIPTFSTFEDAYLAVLRHVGGQTEFVNAPRGNASRECLNISLRLDDPLERTPYLRARKVNIIFHYAEALWYLWGRNDVEMISYYAPQMRSYSADGHTLRGSAYGHRLFAVPGDGEVSRFDRLLALLRREDATKRAVSVAFNEAELDIPHNIDVSCMIALQFLIRDGVLHLICYMRANDADQGLLSDVFSFTLLQEFTANLLGVGIGTYAHHVGSMHIGDRDAGRVERVLVEASTLGPGRVRFPSARMPATSWADLAVLAAHEEALRLDRDRIVPAKVDDTGLAPYWQQVLLLFEVQRQIVHQPGRLLDRAVLEALHPRYQWLISHRWPERMPAPLATSRSSA